MARCWQPTPSGRQRLSVLGALNAVTHELITVTTDAYINSQHVCRLLYRLAARNLTVPITVVLDNARYQRCHLVQGHREALEHRTAVSPQRIHRNSI
jgi:hypothetical protein